MAAAGQGGSRVSCLRRAETSAPAEALRLGAGAAGTLGRALTTGGHEVSVTGRSLRGATVPGLRSHARSGPRARLRQVGSDRSFRFSSPVSRGH